jgi:hypothetical protein
MRIAGLTDETVNTKPAHEYSVHILTPSEQLGNDIKIWIDSTRMVKESCADVQWGRVAVIEPEAGE